MGGGQIAILEEDPPVCPPGGLLIRTEASGLCSGELMDWYMDRKIPHVLGHEVAGIVVESQDSRFPVGCRVAPHHHAPCMKCELCQRGAYVHCEQWKRTKLVPGGMAEFFAVGAENLTDTHVVSPALSERSDDGEGAGGRGELRAIDAALMEPLGCVVKCLWRMPYPSPERTKDYTRPSLAVVGLGVMGLMHALLHTGAICFESNEARRQWGLNLGLDVRNSGFAEPIDFIIVCPGSKDAVDLAVVHIAPGGTIMLFSPLGPPGRYDLALDELYFKDVSLIPSYSCGPEHTKSALGHLRAGEIRAEQVVSHFISIDELPAAYQAMKRGEILKPMVVFD